MDTLHRYRVIPAVAVLAMFTLGGCASSQAQPGSSQAQSSFVGDGIQVERQSASVVTAADIERYPTSLSVEDIIERHIPGMYVRKRNEPGGDLSMHVLGMSGPLWVIDGVPIGQSTSTLGLNPRDIARIEVRKHGAATAEYGMRGSNGVILVTTKIR